MPYHKTCVVCGKSFETTTWNKMVYSDACKIIRDRKRFKIRYAKKTAYHSFLPPTTLNVHKATCCICGKAFTPAFNGEKFCSDSCRQDPRAKKIVRFFTKAFQAIESGCYSFDFQDSIQTLVSL